VLKLLFQNFRFQIAGIVAAGMAASLLEAAGIAIFIPVLEGLNPRQSSAIPFPLNQVTGWLSEMPLPERLRMVALLSVGVFGLKGIALYLGGVLGARLEVSATNLQILRCYLSMLGSRPSYFHRQKGAYLHTVMRQHVGRFGHYARSIAETIPSALTFFVLLGMLILVSLPMTLLAAGLAIVSSLGIQRMHRFAVDAGKNVSKTNVALDATVLDTIHGYRTIKIFVRTRDMIQKFQKDIDLWGKNLVAVAKLQAISRPILEMTSVVGLAILLVMGSYTFLRQDTDGVRLELLLTFLLIFFRLLPPLANLNKIRVSVATIIPICQEVEQFIRDFQSEQVNDGGKTFPGLKETIGIKDLSFHYENNPQWVLKDVTLSIPKGSRVGIVGSSGAGKSTVADLLLRFYDPQQGKILIDGIDLKEFDLASWLNTIGVVSQDTFLFNDTVRNNIAFSFPRASREEIERAAERAHIHDFIMTLPQGYDTRIGDRGVLLSGGQRQRMSIARAILKNPEILIFDEATSALDTKSEQIVQKALDEVARGRTVISIAHRLSTVADSDIIFVLEEGRIVEQGTHDDLLNSKGLYHKLVLMQSLALTS
jgi:subfamily B ATP-binding cassette protein MsbA